MKSAESRRATAQWAAAFPGYSVWKPLRLLRRMGPLVQGITLDIAQSRPIYFPTAHIHLLAQDFPVVSMTLPTRLTNGQRTQIGVGIGSSADDIASFARRLVDESPLSLHAAPTLEEILAEYRTYVTAKQSSIPSSVPELEDFVLLPAAAGFPALAEENLRVVGELSSAWSKNESPRGWQSADAWLESLAAQIVGDLLQKRVDAQVAKHGLADIESVELL